MAMGHVILREFHLDRQAEYFEDYARKYTDMPMLVRLEDRRRPPCAGAGCCGPRISMASWGETNNPDWKNRRL